MDEWTNVIKRVLSLKPHKDLYIEKRRVTHPLYAGFRHSIGEPKGQIADYRLRLINGRSIHVREYKDHYRVHWDIVDPSVNPLLHLKYDAPHWYNILISTIGVAGGLLTQKGLHYGLMAWAAGFVLSLLSSRQ